jgi:hypothetical protein
MKFFTDTEASTDGDTCAATQYQEAIQHALVWDYYMSSCFTRSDETEYLANNS